MIEVVVWELLDFMVVEIRVLDFFYFNYVGLMVSGVIDVIWVF